MSLTINAQPRPEGSKPKALRREGLIPANFYGHDGANSVLLTINAQDLMFLQRVAKVRDTVITLNIEGGWSGPVVLQEVHKHPWKSHAIYHVSFFTKRDDA